MNHEAFAVRKSSARAVPADEPLELEPDQRAWTDERAGRYERLRLGAEAMAGLKPQEIRCLLLKAEGLPYQEICEVTGWTYTKVNRCITEGRRAFLKRVAGIEAGAECERLAPLISRVADGEATPDEMCTIRPHLKGCLACKATLREYRATPARLAGLVPPVVAIAGGGGGGSGFLGRLLDRFAAMGDVAGTKVAVAASAVVLAGGGAAGVTAMHHDAPRVPPAAFAPTDAAPTTSALAPAASAAPEPSTAAIQAVSDPSAPTPTRDPQPSPAAVDPAPEFDPGTSADAATTTSTNEFASAASDPTPASTASPRDDSRSASGPGEFGP